MCEVKHSYWLVNGIHQMVPGASVENTTGGPVENATGGPWCRCGRVDVLESVECIRMVRKDTEEMMM